MLARPWSAPKPRQVVRRTVTLFESFDSVTLLDGSTVAVSVPALQGQLNATDWPGPMLGIE